MRGAHPLVIYLAVTVASAFLVALAAPPLGYPVQLPTSRLGPVEAAALFAAFSLLGLLPGGLFIQTVTDIVDTLRSPRWATVMVAASSAWVVTLVALAYGSWMVGIMEARVILLAATVAALAAARIFPKPRIG